MRLLICAGGTGGGVYPALAVLQAIKGDGERVTDENSSSMEAIGFSSRRLPPNVLWVGSVGGMEADLVEQIGVPFEAIPAAGVHGVGLRALPGNLLQLGRGYRQAGRILRKFRPDVLFFTGGYVAVPVALAGRKIPSVLYTPDIEPGLALKTLARFADCIVITAEESRVFFPHHPGVRVIGYPTRPSLKAWSKEDALQALGLRSDLPILLVMGGSKGARSINRALLTALPEVLAEMQVVHISGHFGWSEVEAARADLADKMAGSASLLDRYRAFPYLHEEMGAALTVADLVLSRAGASTLGELPLFSLPAILVPYPYAWRYQQVNAQYLSQRGAALVIADEDLPDQLLPTVQDLMRDGARREKMRQAMRALAKPEAAIMISRILQSLVTKQDQKRM